MKVDVVADVGNSRIKWGICTRHEVTASASLSPDDPAAWDKQIKDWGLGGSLIWAIGSVHPGNLEVLTGWLRGRRDKVGFLARHDLLPLEIRLGAPERVGVDRLLNAVAANSRLPCNGKNRRARAAVVIDAGTAVTVDWLGPDGAFEGGAIFPGRKLMAAALHDYTALLPLVAGAEATPQSAGAEATPPSVGTNTVAAIEAGVHHAVAGGINQLISLQIGKHLPRGRRATGSAVFLTGGDAAILQSSINNRAVLWPKMTLEGLRLSAEALP